MKFSLLKKSVEELENQIWNCKKCKQLFEAIESGDQMCPVPGFGLQSYLKKVMIICEAPGARKNWQKKENDPKTVEDFHSFYDDRMKNGAAIGKHVNSIISRAGITLDDVFWTNVIKCPPPEYRDPTDEEIKNCMPYLQKQIDLINPKIVICFGRYAKSIFNRGLVETKGKLITTYHPSYLRRYAKSEVRKYEENCIVDALNEVLNE